MAKTRSHQPTNTHRRPGARAPVLGALLLSVTRCAGCHEKVVHPEAIKHHDAAIQYLQQGQCELADERCRLALEYGPNFEHAHNCLGMVEITCNKNLDKAADHFKAALAINPDFAEGHNNLGTCFFRRDPPDYDAACDEFKASIEIDPAYLDGRENYGMCLMRRGLISGDKGDVPRRKELFKESRSHLIRLLEMSPNNFNSRAYLGLMDLIEKSYASSEQNFKRCLEIDPENPICSYQLGNLYLETARCDDAIKAFIVVLRPGLENEVTIGARQNLGEAYGRCAKKDGAILAFLDKIKADPGSPTNHFDLGNIYMEKGLPDNAANEWENTVKLDPLYCPAYYKLSEHANKVLDTASTIRRCQDFVACATEVNKAKPAPMWSDDVAKCKTRVKKLEME